MKVYIAIEIFPYEGEEVLGVYSDKIDAEKKKEEAKLNDLTGGYNEFRVDEHEVE